MNLDGYDVESDFLNSSVVHRGIWPKIRVILTDDCSNRLFAGIRGDGPSGSFAPLRSQLANSKQNEIITNKISTMMMVIAVTNDPMVTKKPMGVSINPVT